MTSNHYETILARIFEFSCQTIEINIALSSFGLLWIVVPFVRERVDFWKLILSQTILLFSDTRTDVAIGALETFFNLLASNATQLPSEIYGHLIVRCFIPQLMAMNEFSAHSWNVQQLTLQDMCHCAISLWRYFDGPEFIGTFWPLLIEKQELFVKSCSDQEISACALQFFEESFPVSQFDQSIRQRLLNSFVESVEHWLANEPPSSLVLSSLGRFVYKIILSQKSFLDDGSIETWMNLLGKMCKQMPCEQFINLSVHKSLEGLLALFPLPQNLAAHVCRQLVATVVDCEIPCVREELSALLARLFEHFVDDKFRFMIDCKRIFALPEVAGLVSTLVKANFDQVPPGVLFESYLDVWQTNQVMRDALCPRILAMLADVAPEQRAAFVRQNVASPVVLQDIWQRYFSPESRRFSQEVYEDCFPIVLQAVGALVRSLGEVELLSLLTFLEAAKAPAKQLFGAQKSTGWFLFDLVPAFGALGDDQRTGVRQAVVRVLAVLNGNLAALLKGK
jgi:hypothetical protein